jgi:putative spermidine/putrescine transport system ATP-binding protein
MKSHSLSIDGLAKRYGGTVALHPTSLEIGAGEFYTLLGPSGSGKTTLLMLIAGFATPSGGDLRLDGRRITDEPPETRNFGMVFQGYALFPHLTVAENVAFPLSIRNLPWAEQEQRVRAALDMVRLSGLADRRPRALSGGQQQRVALARALVFEPALVLLDEPLSALDRRLRKDLQVELKQIHARLGTTFIYVTHDQEEAMSMSDRIAILRDGHVLQTGAPAEIYDRPNSRFVAGFLGETNILEGTLQAADDNAILVRIGETVVRHEGRHPDLSIGSKLCLGLRPEQVTLGDASNRGNTLSGRILTATHFGPYLQLEIDAGIGDKVSLRLSPPASAGTFRTGERIDFSWSPSATRVVADG